MGYVVLMCECMMFLDSSVVRTCNICPLQRLIQQKSQETSWTWVNPLAHLDIEYPVLFPVRIPQTCHQTWLADAWTIHLSAMILPKIDVALELSHIARSFHSKPPWFQSVSICFIVVVFFFSVLHDDSRFSHDFPMKTAPGPSLCHLGGCGGGQGVDGCG